MIQLTIFTPTYNRAYTLTKLYNSLKQQTSKQFIWLIVDDGSTDNTYELYQDWIKENIIQIEYYRQKSNLGKAMAHNKGVELTKTELFTCVDSDDALIHTAVEDILKCWNSRKYPDVVGLLAYKGFDDGRTLTYIKNQKIATTTLRDGYRRYGLKGDTMLIYRRDIISQYSFPYFDDEKFVPEAFLYDLIDCKGKLLILPKVLYICEYLNDGYTKNMSKLLARNPKGYLAFINQRLDLDNSTKYKLCDTIRYISICMVTNQKHFILNSKYPLLAIISLPLGYLLYLKRFRIHK